MQRKLSLALLLLLSVMGCGSSAETSAGQRESGALTKAVFIRRADRSCTKGNKRRELLAARYGEEHGFGANGPPTRAMLGAMISSTLLPEVREQTEELQDRTVPRGDGKKVAAIARALDEAIRRTERDPVSALNENHTPFARASDMARAYGFRVCGRY